MKSIFMCFLSCCVKKPLQNTEQDKKTVASTRVMSTNLTFLRQWRRMVADWRLTYTKVPFNSCCCYIIISSHVASVPRLGGLTFSTHNMFICLNVKTRMSFSIVHQEHSSARVISHQPSVLLHDFWPHSSGLASFVAFEMWDIGNNNPASHCVLTFLFHSWAIYFLIFWWPNSFWACLVLSGVMGITRLRALNSTQNQVVWPPNFAERNTRCSGWEKLQSRLL